ncbi:acyl-CoA--sterol O-acyltransferase 1 [Ricinus communis]|uniref:acyl-CoA--sterol O-acyltransferase 1 n=1 Tax=Ricinus communis TaxID=3988 RepID=UPI00201A4D75|nr:acyl-CoA--sterol O-acyltransferase 1 [Ricinus communis]
MEGKAHNFIKAWLLIFASLSYCFATGKIIPKGSTRLFFLLPIVCLFLILPLNISSVHFQGMTAFFIAWLANFKLLLFAFGKGPLSSNNSSTSFTRFVLNACLPIKIQENPSQGSHINSKNKENPHLNSSKKCHKSFPNYAIKGILLALLIRVYDYHEFIHPNVILVLYYLHIYLFLELVLAMLAALARAMIGVELEPQFNEPYLSTSLQDFWGRRWNLMVTSILRPTVYDPLIRTSSPIIGRRWASLPAILGTFTVSAIMHELIFYYLGRVRPTWEITWFFMLHGVCLVAEVAFKKAVNGRWRLSRFVSTPLTIGFVAVTGFWLFFPSLLRCKTDVRAFEEYSALSEFVKSFDVRSFNMSLFGGNPVSL